jgi:hypothetical protein
LNVGQRQMKRIASSLSFIWIASLLTAVFWSYLLIFRMPIHVAALYEEGRQTPLVTQHTIDLVGGERGTTLLILWAVVATAALLVGKSAASEGAYRNRRKLVLSLFFVPLLAGSVILLLPELR